MMNDDQAKQHGIYTKHETMGNGERRFRLLHEDGSSYCRTESTQGAWQNSHFHKGITELYVVQKGWIAFAELTTEDKVQIRILNQGKDVKVKPFLAHNIYMSADSVIHTIKYGSSDIATDWFASPKLDEHTRYLESMDLIRWQE